MEKRIVSTDEESREAKALPLLQAPAGRDLRVVRLNGGHGMKRRLTDMGLHVGTTIRILQRGRPGPMIVHYKGGRIALGRGVLERVLVEVVE